MPNFSSNLKISDAINNISYSFAESGAYQQLYQIEKTIDDTDNPATQSLIDLIPGSKGGAQLEDIEFMCVYNKGIGTAEIRIKYTGMENDSNLDKFNSTPGLTASLLRPGEFMTIPNIWGCNYNTAGQGAANTTLNEMDNTVVSGALKRDSGEDIADDLINGEELESGTTATEFNVDNAGYYIIGDLIQLGTEILRITGISSNTLTVERGVFGSTAATHVDNLKVEFPYFNAYHDYNTFAKPQTDLSGNFKCFNFFGRGRHPGPNTTYGATGICRGSVALKFYEPAYTEFGLSNVVANESSGLTANTIYVFDLVLNEVVAKDSATAKGTIVFTTDSSNVSWGSAYENGTDTGVLQKIKDAMDAKFRDVTDALYGLNCEIEIINGDVRLTSHSRLSDSRVGLSVGTTAGTGGGSVFGVGNFPGVSSNTILSEGKVIGSSTNQVTYGDAARLPDDTFRKDGVIYKNAKAFLIDNGFGQLVPGSSGYAGGITRGPSERANSGNYGARGGFGSGTIDYTTGAINITGGPKMAEFVVSGMFATAIGTGGGSASNGIIASVHARSVSSKVDSVVQLLAFGR